MAPEPGGSRWLPPRAPGPGAGPPPRPEAPGAWPPRAPAPPPAPAPAGQPQAPDAAPPVRDPFAVAAIVLGVSALGLTIISLGTLFVVTLPMAAVGLACGQAAARRIRAGETQMGAAQARWGRILSIGALVLGILAAIAWIALLSSGVDVEGWLEDLRGELEQEREDGDPTPAPQGRPALL
jgi:hypothetical protein